MQSSTPRRWRPTALRGIRYADPRRGAITVCEYGEDVFLPSMLHLRPNSRGAIDAVLEQALAGLEAEDLAEQRGNRPPR